MDTTKRLYRSDTSKVFAGICGGLGEYADIDPVIVRLIWLLIVVFTGIIPGIIVYGVATFIIPKQNIVDSSSVSDTAAL